jgi:hypothetical protein
MRRITWALLPWLATAILSADPPTAVALRNARIVTVSGPEIPNGTVLLRDGLIERVGENLQIPEDAWVIEGKGLTVYPGLIDALSGIGIAPVPGTSQPVRAAQPSGGRRGGVSPEMPVSKWPEDRPSNYSWIRAADLFDPADRRIEEARSAGFTSAVVHPPAGIFAGQSAIVNLAEGKKGRMVVAAPAAQYITFATRGGAGEFPASLMGVIAYVRQVWLDASHYRVEKTGYERRVAGTRRPDYDRAVEGLLESPRVLLPASSAVEIDRMLRFASELKMPAILYGGHEAFRVPAVAAKAGVPLLISLRWPERSRDADPDDPVSLRTLELWDQAPSSPAALAKAGVRFAFYSGGAAPREISRAVRKAMEAGLSPAAAVRAFTLSAAEIYGIADRLGSIEPGKIGNLVVTEGNIFQEKTKVKYVFVDGEKYEPVTPAEAAPGPRAGAPRPGDVR